MSTPTQSFAPIAELPSIRRIHSASPPDHQNSDVARLLAAATTALGGGAGAQLSQAPTR
jgi:hypothetical protein